MFSKYTFGVRNYGHYHGYREKGEQGPALTHAWQAAQKAKRRRAEARKAAHESAKRR